MELNRAAKSGLKRFLGIAFILVVTFMFAPSVEVLAFLACQGSSCEGLNPNSTGCDEGASTVQQFTGN